MKRVALSLFILGIFARPILQTAISNTQTLMQMQSDPAYKVAADVERWYGITVASIRDRGDTIIVFVLADTGFVRAMPSQELWAWQAGIMNAVQESAFEHYPDATRVTVAWTAITMAPCVDGDCPVCYFERQASPAAGPVPQYARGGIRRSLSRDPTYRGLRKTEKLVESVGRSSRSPVQKLPKRVGFEPTVVSHKEELCLCGPPLLG